MVTNSCLEDLEGRITLKRMWKFVAQVGNTGKSRWCKSRKEVGEDRRTTNLMSTMCKW